MVDQGRCQRDLAVQVAVKAEKARSAAKPADLADVEQPPFIHVYTRILLPAYARIVFFGWNKSVAR